MFICFLFFFLSFFILFSPEIIVMVCWTYSNQLINQSIFFFLFFLFARSVARSICLSVCLFVCCCCTLFFIKSSDDTCTSFVLCVYLFLSFFLSFFFPFFLHFCCFYFPFLQTSWCPQHCSNHNDGTVRSSYRKRSRIRAMCSIVVTHTAVYEL